MRVSAASLRTLTSIVGLSLLAACSGAGQSSSAQSPGILPSTQQALASHIETGAASPDHCKGTGGVLVLPCKLVFNSPSTQVVTVSPFGASYQLPTVNKGCNGFATFQYFDYGMFNVSPGTTKGTCKAVFTVKTSGGKILGHSTLHLTNNT
jgi:hypothetical protein